MIFKKICVSLMGSVLLCSCASTTNKYKIEQSFLEQSQKLEQLKQGDVDEISFTTVNDNAIDNGKIKLSKINRSKTGVASTNDLLSSLGTKPDITVNAEHMGLAQFLHHALGKILNLNYVIGETVSKSEQTVTLSLKKPISAQEFFSLVKGVLVEKKLTIEWVDNILYVVDESKLSGANNVVFSYGDKVSENVPTSSRVLQILPLKYGYKNQYRFLLQKVARLDAEVDAEQGVLYLLGSYSDVKKGVEFISLVDRAFFKEKEISFYKSRFVTSAQLLVNIKKILQKEGLDNAVEFVDLKNQSALVYFSNSKDVHRRASDWLEMLDAPSDLDDKQYFIYQPVNARASDLLESLAPLIGNVSSTSSTKTKTEGQANNNGALGVSNDKYSISVDKLSNALVINATGKNYRYLLPLIERLDVMPKQVILEVVIAEVTLQNEFRLGVEFFLKENNFTLGTLNSFGINGFSGLNYSLVGNSKWDVNALLKDSNSLINVLSRPYLLVRDGKTTKMKVGTDIPIVNSTTTPDVGVSESVQYRKTGLTMSVTPTVNSQGIVIMSIEQEISNVVDGGITANGAPSIFDRSFSTELVARSGETVILGGLISENKTKRLNRVPALGDIPILGNLFSGESDVGDKTELVVLVTPRIIDESTSWDNVFHDFKEKLTQLDL